MISAAYNRCETILQEQRDKLEAVAKYLLENETMEREAFLAVFDAAESSAK